MPKVDSDAIVIEIMFDPVQIIMTSFSKMCLWILWRNLGQTSEKPYLQPTQVFQFAAVQWGRASST